MWQWGIDSAQSWLCTAQGDLTAGRKFCLVRVVGEHRPVTHVAGGTLITAQPRHESREEVFLLHVQIQLCLVQTQTIFHQLFVLGSSSHLLQGCCPSRVCRT